MISQNETPNHGFEEKTGREKGVLLGERENNQNLYIEILWVIIE